MEARAVREGKVMGLRTGLAIAFVGLFMVGCGGGDRMSKGEDKMMAKDEMAKPGVAAKAVAMEAVQGLSGAKATLGDYTHDLIATVGDRVHFAFNSSRLDDRSRNTLNRQAGWLLANPDVSLTIEGHCDERGTREYNIGLGARRATAMRDFLVRAGVDPYRLRVISFGKERPVAACSRETCWRLNRRAASVVSGVGG